MADVIVIQFVSLDGVVSDPLRFAPGPVRDDVFRLGARMEQGVQLYGRRTWEQFARLWPGRDSDYAKLMNTVPKRVATRTGLDAAAWPNSAAIEGDPVAWATAERTRRDVVVIGSLSVVRALAAADVVDEYRLLTVPVVAGDGERLFGGSVTGGFRFGSVEQVGTGVLSVLHRERGSAPVAEGADGERHGDRGRGADGR